MASDHAHHDRDLDPVTGHEAEHAHGIAHVAERKILLGTWIALMILTVVTVTATTVSYTHLTLPTICSV